MKPTRTLAMVLATTAVLGGVSGNIEAEPLKTSSSGTFISTEINTGGDPLKAVYLTFKGKGTVLGPFSAQAFNESQVILSPPPPNCTLPNSTPGIQLGIVQGKFVFRLLITADRGGSNGSRCRLWQVTLHRLADDLGLCITVCHFPPGTSNWNKLEHRLFRHLASNWRGHPLTSLAVLVKLIATTTTRQGLYVQADLDTRPYPTSIVVTAQQLAEINLKRADFHGDWNYTIHPRTTPN